MKLNDISFPIKLSQWQIQCGGANLYTYYYEWNSGSSPPEPYAGGWGLVVWNPPSGAAGAGTSVFNVYWIGFGQIALQASDTGTYAAVSQGAYRFALGLTDGSHDDQRSNLSITQNGSFMLTNLTTGGFALQTLTGPYAGKYLNVKGSRWQDWHFYTVEPADGPLNGDEIFTLASGSQFDILLISGSGVGLALRGQDLAQGGYIASVAGVDFTGADLTGADLSKLPELSVAKANFSRATLSGAIMKGVRDINQATWTQATLVGTDLSQVDPSGTAGANMSTALLTQANLRGLQFEGASFEAARMDGAILDHGRFRGVNFKGANLSGARLIDADLTGADLTNADLTRANLTGTILTGATLAGTIFETST